MIKRIDLFMPPRSQYGVLHHFTKKMYEALTRNGITCKLMEAEYYNPAPFIDALMSDPPDCTLSFNGLLPDDKGRFFCEMIGIPHVACIVDSQNLFIPMIHSPLTVIVCADRFSSEFFRGLKSKNVLFMPHAVEKELAPDENAEKQYDVTVLCSLMDIEKLRKGWEEKYTPFIRTIMEEAIETTMSDSSTSYVQALVEAIDKHMEIQHNLDTRKVDFISIMDDIEMYIKGKSRIDIVKSVKDATVHVFGSVPEGTSWEHYLGKDHANVIIHDPVPYEQALQILKQSKIVLNSSPWIKNGAHERIFSGLASGALVITNDNIFMREHFKDGKNIVLYQENQLDQVNEKINEYLSDDAKRKSIAESGRKLVMKHHTWDQRAIHLIKELEPILENIKEEMRQKQEEAGSKEK